MSSNGEEAPSIRRDLFNDSVKEGMRQDYLASQPYNHLVISDLINSNLLKATREELKTNVQATLKETDIYKVYQTGDLANLDGLPPEERALFPNLTKLRDALYSIEFRKLVAGWTGAGPLSGTHIDLSVNAYGHTGHLLCHDDVIGSRKVSYILYLVDPSWDTGAKRDGGALQLYPLEVAEKLGVPAYAPSKTIPPRWNQMVLFAVAPGSSFHDVEEVYNEEEPRLAISGWFHPAEEEELNEWSEEVKAQGRAHDATYKGLSTLAQLEAGGGSMDADVNGADDSAPGPLVVYRDEEGVEPSGSTEADIKLEDWINPDYLKEKTIHECFDAFEANGSTLQLHKFLRADVAAKVLTAMKAADELDGVGYMEATPFDTGVRGGWRTVGPPHRRRYLRLSREPPAGDACTDDGVGSILRSLAKVLTSSQFQVLAQKLTGLKLLRRRASVRRFRPGLDYTLATPSQWECEGECVLLDAVLCFVDDAEPYKEAAWRQDEVGGYHTYLGGEEDELNGDSPSDIEDTDTTINTNENSHMDIHESTAGGARGNGCTGAREGVPKKDNDAAVYKADEGGSLLSVSAACNSLSLVVRDDAEVLSFIKYISSAAPGSRFDICAEYEADLFSDDEEDEAENLADGGEEIPQKSSRNFETSAQKGGLNEASGGGSDTEKPPLKKPKI